MSLFNLGNLCYTPGAMDSIGLIEIHKAVERHSVLDQGELDEFDHKQNQDAVKNGDNRIFSCYKIRGHNVYVITEEDRSVTTVLLAVEY